jgi:hypothetical protein
MAKRKSKIEVPWTYEGALAAEKAQFETHYRDYGIQPEPTLQYGVGQQVRFASYGDIRVEEILEGGRILHLSTPDKGVSYGKAWYMKRRRPVILWWYEVSPIVPAGAPVTAFNQPRLETQYHTQELRGFLHVIYRRGVIDSPEYQRDYVWTLEDKRRLIRSVFEKTDIGKFVTMSHKFPEDRLEIIDGKQRINALREFREGRFTFEGASWFDLSTSDQTHFGLHMVQVTELDRERVKRSDILRLFLTLNAGGVPQTEEHIQKAKALYEAALEEEGRRDSGWTPNMEFQAQSRLHRRGEKAPQISILELGQEAKELDAAVQRSLDKKKAGGQ